MIDLKDEDRCDDRRPSHRPLEAAQADRRSQFPSLTSNKTALGRVDDAGRRTQAPLVDGGGIDGGNGAFFANAGEDLHAIGSLALIVAGHLGVIVIRPDGSRYVARAVPDPLAPSSRTELVLGFEVDLLVRVREFEEHAELGGPSSFPASRDPGAAGDEAAGPPTGRPDHLTTR
jgi:hypothetical protein